MVFDDGYSKMIKRLFDFIRVRMMLRKYLLSLVRVLETEEERLSTLTRIMIYEKPITQPFEIDFITFNERHSFNGKIVDACFTMSKSLLVKVELTIEVCGQGEVTPI